MGEGGREVKCRQSLDLAWALASKLIFQGALSFYFPLTLLPERNVHNTGSVSASLCSFTTAPQPLPMALQKLL